VYRGWWLPLICVAQWSHVFSFKPLLRIISFQHAPKL
jgi:hypothetical protein